LNLSRAEGTLLVTGGSRGIGAAIVRQAAAAGYPVALTYVQDAAAAEALVAEVTARGGRAYAVRADVAVEDDILAAFSAAETALGPLGALVNNAGITGPIGRVEALDRAMLERLFAINVIGTLLCAREAVRRMSTKHGGRGGVIVNLTSVAARIGGPGELVHYAATKGAVDSITVGLAREVAAEGIRVNAVAPGLIETEIHAAAGDAGRPARLAASIPMQRTGSAEEVAQCVLWLLSPAASYVTGATIDVSGGR
jgi:NAD(P)-dependent dehydrogenase (short-subunit alcohol dehydrogenase family)